jgi:ribonuclease HII
MAVLVGIDEAGFGPILGPLVVSSTVFSLPENLLKADLWEVLRKSVGSRRKHLGGRLLVADSKKAHTAKEGTKHIKRATLAALNCLGQNPATLTQLLAALCPECLSQLSDCPWYGKVDSYEISADGADIAIASMLLGNDLASNNMKLLGIRSCCLDAGYYNRMVSVVRNKARVLFTATSSLIKNAFDEFGGDNLNVIIDRHGGRMRYRGPLQRMFADLKLKILQENQKTSSYQLEGNGKSMRLHFVVEADDRFLPVSLASMVSKFLRELLMDNINRYFAGFYSGLKPTAGYWKDGLRFIKDLKTYIPQVQYDSNLLIRSR